MTAPDLKNVGPAPTGPTKATERDNLPMPILLERQQDFKTAPSLTHCNKRVVFAGTWFDFMILMIEASTHLHERLGTQEIDRDEASKIVNELRRRPDPADRVDFSDEIQALDKLQNDIDGMILLHARAACIEDALQDPFIDKDTACELLDELAGIYNEIGKE
jgi:hypothetical protein